MPYGSGIMSRMIPVSYTHLNHNLIENGKRFLELKKTQYMYMMYVWGHSYEFDRDNNWEPVSYTHLGKKVLVLERRSHIGGNCYDEPDEHGLLIHNYGCLLYTSCLTH